MLTDALDEHDCHWRISWLSMFWYRANGYDLGTYI